MKKHVKITLRLTNSLESDRTVVLEPWSGEYTLRPGKAFDIVAEGDPTSRLEIELSNERVIVYSFASVDAQLSIFQDGNEILTSE